MHGFYDDVLREWREWQVQSIVDIQDLVKFDVHGKFPIDNPYYQSVLGDSVWVCYSEHENRARVVFYSLPVDIDAHDDHNVVWLLPGDSAFGARMIGGIYGSPAFIEVSMQLCNDIGLPIIMVVDKTEDGPSFVVLEIRYTAANRCEAYIFFSAIKAVFAKKLNFASLGLIEES